jgi:SRSO17 transposase
VLDTWRLARTKPEIAIAKIGRLIAAGLTFGTVLGDAGYGLSAPFRQASAHVASPERLAFRVGKTRMRASISPAIITSPRHQTLILIVAAPSSRSSPRRRSSPPWLLML